MNANRSSDEIDLMELLARLYSYLRENWILTLSVPILGILLGITYNIVVEQKRELTMVVLTNTLSAPECDFLFQQLQRDTLPGLTFEEQRRIKIEHEVIEDPSNKTSAPGTNNRLYVEIMVIVWKLQGLDKIQNSILNYLEKSKLVTGRREELKQQYAAMIEQIDKELGYLDQMKKLTGEKGGSGFLNPASLFTETINLTEKKLKYQAILRDNLFQLTKGFDLVKPKEKLSILVAGGIGFVIGVILLFIILFVKYFNAYYKAYKQTHPV